MKKIVELLGTFKAEVVLQVLRGEKTHRRLPEGIYLIQISQ